MQISTWVRTSHGLFDYESHNVVASQLNVTADCELTRVDGDVITEKVSRGDRENLVSIRMREETKSF